MTLHSNRMVFFTSRYVSQVISCLGWDTASFPSVGAGTLSQSLWVHICPSPVVSAREFHSRHLSLLSLSIFLPPFPQRNLSLDWIKTTNLGLMKWVLNSVFEGGWLSRQTLYRSRTMCLALLWVCRASSGMMLMTIFLLQQHAECLPESWTLVTKGNAAT